VQIEEQTLHPTAPDLALVPKETEPLRKKKKGPKAPNPLSVKKKRSKVDEGGLPKKISFIEDEQTNGKRKRTEDALDSAGIRNEGGGHKRKRRRKGATNYLDTLQSLQPTLYP
jgi:U3 small nucleolar RNA-associated protein 23